MWRFEGLETFFEKKKFTSFHLDLSSSCLASSLFFSSLFSSLDLLFSCLVSPLSSSHVSSLLFHLLLSFLVSPLPSSRFFSFLSSSLVFSRLSSFIFSFLLCLSFSVSLCLCLRVVLCVVVLCGVCRCGRGVVVGRGVCLCACLCVLRHAEKNVKKTVCRFKNVSVCTFKTSPCMPAPRAHVFRNVRVVRVYTETF